jgi:hypothetical protein
MSRTNTVTSACVDAERGVVSPRFLLRVAGLPISTVEGLCLTESVEWAREVLRLEAELREESQTIIDAIHAAVPAHDDDQSLQRAMLSLKRDIFNARAPKNRTAAASVAALPELSGTALGRWLERVTRRELLLADGRRLFEAEQVARRERLKAVISDPSFRKGLLVASPTLESDIDNYLRAPSGKLNRRLRLVERAATLYLLRTACKTSPFSTLGVVTDGVFGEDEPPAETCVSYRVAGMEKQSFVRLNVAILSRLSALLLTCEEVQRDLPLRVKEGWELQGDRVRYLRRTVSISESAGPQTMDAAKESIFYLPLSPTLMRLLELLGRGGEGRLGSLALSLAGEGADEDDVRKIEEFLVHLLRLDLLVVPELRLPTHSRDFLADYAARLATLDGAKTGEVARALRRVESLVEAYAEGSLGERRAIRKSIGQEVADCYRLLGAGEEHVPHTLLYEDATIRLPQLGLNAGQWEGRIEALREVQRVLPIFDLTVAPRLVMNAFFKTIYGEGQQCDDVLSFAEVFTQDYYDQYRRASMRRAQLDAEGNFVPSINHFKIPEISLLDELREEFASYLGRELAAAPDGCREMALSAEAVREIGARIPAKVGRLSSHTFFSQLAETEEGPRLVVNRIYSGLTQMFSRFLQPLEDGGRAGLGDDIRETLERLQPPEAVFAELQGGTDTNLNLHPSVTRYEIVCPGDPTSRPADEQIPVADLYIEHDRASDTLRLRSRRLGCEVIPLYLGFLLPAALPQLRQVLINFSCPSFATPYFWVGVKGGPKVGKTIAFYPRLRFGDVVLQRGIWKMSPDYLPRRAPMQSDADYFLAVTRWRQENGLPRRVFLTPDSYSPRGAEEAAPDEPKEQPEKSAKAEKNEKADNGREIGVDQLIRKPMYVDFENFFCVTLLERVVTRSSARLVMTEMLPDMEHLWFQHGDEPYVTELILELSRQHGGSDE